jgi:hypothetical protein
MASSQNRIIEDVRCVLMALNDSPQINLVKASKKLIAIKRNLIWAHRTDLAEELQVLYSKICAEVQNMGPWPERSLDNR